MYVFELPAQISTHISITVSINTYCNLIRAHCNLLELSLYCMYSIKFFFS